MFYSSTTKNIDGMSFSQMYFLLNFKYPNLSLIKKCENRKQSRLFFVIQTFTKIGIVIYLHLKKTYITPSIQNLI